MKDGFEVMQRTATERKTLGLLYLPGNGEDMERSRFLK